MSLIPELVRLQKLAETIRFHRLGQADNLASVGWGSRQHPIWGFHFGSTNPKAPCLLLVGGVHGLEIIGTQTLLSYLEGLVEHLQWDQDSNQRLSQVRLAVLPLINPVGAIQQTRSNGDGVDLMRSAPVTAERPHWLVGGQRKSSRLPYFCGTGDLPLEASTLCDYVRQNIFPSEMAIALDLHSGFGFQDQIWYPFAHTDKPFPDTNSVLGLHRLLDRTYPNHVYKIEPQALHYQTHGDLWDYLYLEHAKVMPKGLFMPLTLEMGSWNWLRKNPIQILTNGGIFNPIKAHRQKRVFRRHLVLFDFLLRAIRNPQAWVEMANA